MKITEAIRSKPFEMFVGALFTFVGIGMAALLVSTWQVIGGVLAALGGALLSLYTAGVNSKAEAKAILKDELETVSRHLGTTVSQINRTIQSVQNGTESAETAIALISQATPTLTNTVNDIQQIAGSAFRSDEIIATGKALDVLATQFSDLVSKTSLPEKDAQILKNEVENIVESARKQITSDIPTSIESIDCPECGANFMHPIGIATGSSSMPTCEKCGAKFHAHRGTDGNVFTKKRGKPPAKGIFG